MNGFKGLFKGKNSNSSVANALAKDYQKKATKAFKLYSMNNPDAKLFSGFAISIKSLNFKERTVEIDFDPKKKIFGTKCKSEEPLYSQNEFVRPDNLKKADYWYIGRDYDEILPFIEALKHLDFHPMWKLDVERNNYVLFPVFFVN